MNSCDEHYYNLLSQWAIFRALLWSHNQLRFFREMREQKSFFCVYFIYSTIIPQPHSSGLNLGQYSEWKAPYTDQTENHAITE